MWKSCLQLYFGRTKSWIWFYKTGLKFKLNYIHNYWRVIPHWKSQRRLIPAVGHAIACSSTEAGGGNRTVTRIGLVHVTPPQPWRNTVVWAQRIWLCSCRAYLLIKSVVTRTALRIFITCEVLPANVAQRFSHLCVLTPMFELLSRYGGFMQWIVLLKQFTFRDFTLTLFGFQGSIWVFSFRVTLLSDELVSLD